MTRRLAAPAERRRRDGVPSSRPRSTLAERVRSASWVLISDIDGTLIGDRPEVPNPALGELARRLAAAAGRVVFGVATGRLPLSAAEVLAAHGLPAPEIIIGAVGTEIYYGPDYVPDPGWADHISYRWDRPRLVELLSEFETCFYLQEDELQTPHKASYYVTSSFGPGTMEAVRERARGTGLSATVVFSHNRYLDFLPRRAGKGKALRFLRDKWEKPLTRFVTCGNSGNDAEMLKGDVQGVVVGNYSPELEALRGGRNLYFAAASLAGGVLEGLRHYGVLAE